MHLKMSSGKCRIFCLGLDVCKSTYCEIVPMWISKTYPALEAQWLIPHIWKCLPWTNQREPKPFLLNRTSNTCGWIKMELFKKVCRGPFQYWCSHRDSYSMETWFCCNSIVNVRRYNVLQVKRTKLAEWHSGNVSALTMDRSPLPRSASGRKSQSTTVPCNGRTTGTIGTPPVGWSSESHGRCFVG